MSATAGQLDPKKYKVQKRREMGEGYTDLNPGTYFVIQDRDLFGAPTLWQYASLVQAMLELSPNIPKEMQEELRALADGVVTLAETWQRKLDRKIPDA